jgi:hypothetical protein
MSNKVLFLDIDGVLNNHRLMNEYYELGLEWHTDIVDPRCVELLNDICAKTGCDIVISSTWRLLYTTRHICAILVHAGFLYERNVVGKTIKKWSRRGEQIHKWLQFHERYNKVAIVDDDSDMEPLMQHLVQTTYTLGLTREIADKLIEKLNS